jgi:hypothetical protein
MDIDVVRLARDWIAEQQSPSGVRINDHLTETSTDKVLHLPFEDPHAAWEFIEQVLSLTNSTDILGKLAAQTLETIIAQDHSHAIDNLDTLIRKHPVVREMLQGVWQNDTPDEIWVKVVARRSS